MIKIIITDIQNESSEVLRRTAELLQAIASDNETQRKNINYDTETSDIEIAKEIAANFRTHGVPAELITSKTPDQKLPEPMFSDEELLESCETHEAEEVAEPSPTEIFSTPQNNSNVKSNDTNIDSRGIPWNARIHSSSKSKTKTGEWRTKKNVDPKLVQEIEQQYKDNQSEQLPPPPIKEELPAPPPAAIETPQVKPVTFTSLVMRIQKLKGEKKITQGQIVEILDSVGIASLHLLNTQQELLPVVNQLIDEAIKNAE